MSNEEQFLQAVGRASIMAGPLFTALFALLQYQASAPEAFAIAWRDLPRLAGSTLLLVPLTMMVGACLAFPVCLILGGVLLFFANRLPLARPMVLWMAIGGGAALGISHSLFSTTLDAGALAFMGTAMACAALVRSRFHLE